MEAFKTVAALLAIVLCLYTAYRLVRGTGEPWHPPEDDDEMF